MSGDWIKMRSGLDTNPRVVEIAERLGIHELHAVGLLWKVWSWADQHSINGNAIRVTESFLDRMTGAPGLSSALRNVGWIEGEDGKISFPRFNEHNGKTAKAREGSAVRVAKHREKVKRNRNVTDVTSELHVTVREEKRREENKEVEEEGNCVEISEQKSILEHQEYLEAIGAEAVFKTGPSKQCREWWEIFPKSTKLDACSKVYASTLGQVASQFKIKIEDAHERLKAITRNYANSPQGKSERWCCSALNFLVEGRWREDPSKWQLREKASDSKMMKSASETVDAAFDIYQKRKERELSNVGK